MADGERRDDRARSVQRLRDTPQTTVLLQHSQAYIGVRYGEHPWHANHPARRERRRTGDEQHAGDLLGGHWTTSVPSMPGTWGRQ